MLIFLARIQPGTTKRDIYDFISPVIKGGLFATKGILENIEIMAFRDSRANTTEYHALVEVAPDKAALRMVQQLNRKKLSGKPINVRVYHIRNRKNDRRLKDQHPALQIKQRRLSERRRDALEIMIMQETINFKGDIQYARRMQQKTGL